MTKYSRHSCFQFSVISYSCFLVFLYSQQLVFQFAGFLVRFCISFLSPSQVIIFQFLIMSLFSNFSLTSFPSFCFLHFHASELPQFNFFSFYNCPQVFPVSHCPKLLVLMFPSLSFPFPPQSLFFPLPFFSVLHYFLVVRFPCFPFSLLCFLVPTLLLVSQFSCLFILFSYFFSVSKDFPIVLTFQFSCFPVPHCPCYLIS